MSGEIIAIISASTGLAALMIGLFAWLRSDMAKVEERLRRDMAKGEERLRRDVTQVEFRLDGKLGALESQIGDLRERMAHLEGLLEGLREAIAHRAA